MAKSKGESFDFGYNVRPKFTKPKGGKKPRKRGRSSAKSKKYWSGQYGS